MPVDDPTKCSGPVTDVAADDSFDFEIFPNPSSGIIHVNSKKGDSYDLQVFNSLSERIFASRASGSITIDVQHQPQGIFVIIINRDGERQIKKVIKL